MRAPLVDLSPTRGVDDASLNDAARILLYSTQRKTEAYIDDSPLIATGARVIGAF